jgi:hydrogenase expression/formation protein HypD
VTQLVTISAAERELKFRDPGRARALARALESLCDEIGRAPISVMHVCGSHEQSIAKYGIRSILPKSLDVIMGPGCPVCVTDLPEVDEAVALAEDGVIIATYGDMLRVPGTASSLQEAVARGGRVEVVYSAAQAVDCARANPTEQVSSSPRASRPPPSPPPPSCSAARPRTSRCSPPTSTSRPSWRSSLKCRTHASRDSWPPVTPPRSPGGASSSAFVEKHRIPVVVAGFEPLDVLAGLTELVRLIRNGEKKVSNTYPRCVTKEGNRNAQQQLWRVFRTAGGNWRGIAHVPNGNLRLRDEFAHLDTRKRFTIDLRRYWTYAPAALTQSCICGDIMAGIAAPAKCRLFGKECVPDSPVGACMVSSEGTCRIWHTYGGHPDL